MATAEAISGNGMPVTGKGAQKVKGKSHGANPEAASFMGVLMQLLGPGFSPEEMKKLQALVMEGMKDGKLPAAGKEHSGEKEDVLNWLQSALDRIAGEDPSSITKTAGPGVTVISDPLKCKPDASELKQDLKVLQSEKIHPAGKKAVYGMQAIHRLPEHAEAETGKTEALKGNKIFTQDKKENAADPVIVRPAEDDIEIDLDALKALLRKTDGANAAAQGKGTLPEGDIGMEAPGLQQLIGEQLKPLLAQIAAETGKKDTISIRVKDGELEKKFTIRKDVILTAHRDGGQEETENTKTEALKVSGQVMDRTDSAGAKLFGSEKDPRQENAVRSVFAEHEKVLMREMVKPAENSAGNLPGDTEFSRTMVKYILQGPAGRMEKLFYKEIETPGVEKKTLLIKTEFIQSPVQAESGGLVLTGGAFDQAGDPDGIKPQAVIRQVADGVESALAKDCSRVRMELNPPQLGTLNMDLTVNHDRVRMIIMADSKDARNILQGNMDQLRSSLEQQGLKMDGVDIFFQDRYPGEQGNQSGHARDGGFRYGAVPGRENGPAGLQGAQDVKPPMGRHIHHDGTGLSVFV